MLALLVSASAAALGAADAPPLAARLEACGRGRAAFVASMPGLRGTEHMEMRFDLQVRERRAWRTVPAPAFGVWERSAPGRAGFVYAKRVEGLQTGVRYRAVVRFRWLAADDALQRRARRVTPSCRSRPAAPGRPGARATMWA